VIALDTNILVRYIASDDPAQSKRAEALIEGELSAERPGFVAAITLCETLWVLRDRYRFSTAAQATVVETLLNSGQFVVEHEDCVAAALRSGHGDIADALIHFIGVKAGCTHTVTFDRRFARLGGVELVA
jgi:predicted nucleic-acid-binding protein